MEILPGLKTCRKGLHQYTADLKECPECKRDRCRRWYEQNRDKKKEYDRLRYEQNSEQVKEQRRFWYRQNSDRQKKNSRRWCEQNRDRGKESRRRWYKQNLERRKEVGRLWQKNNPCKVNAINSKHRAAKKQAVAPWADLDTIKRIYAEAVELSKSTGIPHQVDHIYPLQSDYMCGLHVETNLQVLTQSENAAKRNRTWPDQLDCQRLPIKKVFTPEQIALAQEQTDPT